MRFRRPGSQQQDLFKQLGHASRLALRTTPLDKLSSAVDFEVFRDKLDELLGYKDNLNTHGDASLYATFEPEKARALAEKFERHHTPKHGSWLNMAEIEISALTRTALPERIGSLEEFRERCSLAVERRNAEGRHTVWQFAKHEAPIKLRHLYPSIQGG